MAGTVSGMKRLVVVPVLVLAAGLLGSATPAVAAPPTERTVEDAREPGKAYDIRTVTMTSAARKGRKATIVVGYDRRVRVGDGLDVWIDTDRDRVPDLYLTAFAFSEYAVYKARGWDGHGRDISDRGCATLRMKGLTSMVRFDPSCLRPSTRFAVSVRSFVQGRPARTADHVPGRERLTRRVLSYQPS
jgi:hypothetical protein